MYKFRQALPSLIKREGRLIKGERIETKVLRMLNNKEPIKDGAPMIYTERKDGVQAGYNIRTDRFELAADAMDSIHRSKIAKSDNVMKIVPPDETKSGTNDGEPEPISGTD